MIDLFSGLGGASRAFCMSEKWVVQRYEKNPVVAEKAGATHVVDLMKEAIPIPEHATLVWASPPCVDFSRAFDAPGPRAQREGVDFEPNMSLVEKAVEIIEEVNPEFWVIENVVGAIRHFEPLLGKPRQIIGPFVLWGNFPFIHVERDFHHSKFEGDTWSSDPIRAQRRAKVPLEISSGLMQALEHQTTLEHWSQEWGVNQTQTLQDLN